MLSGTITGHCGLEKSKSLPCGEVETHMCTLTCPSAQTETEVMPCTERPQVKGHKRIRMTNSTESDRSHTCSRCYSVKRLCFSGPNVQGQRLSYHKPSPTWVSRYPIMAGRKVFTGCLCHSEAVPWALLQSDHDHGFNSVHQQVARQNEPGG